MKIRERYKLNKEAKVGQEIICPSCNTFFEKTNYQQAFCKSKSGTICKDKYWNTVTPGKRNNTTRISPASARWSASQESKRQYRVPHAWEVFGVWHDDDWNEGSGGSGSV